MGTHYETLGVAPSAKTAEIRKAYLRRARALHPDRQLGRPEDEASRAEKAMQQVNVAWDVLSDPKKKAEYDQSLKGRRSARRSQPRPTQARPTPQARAATHDGHSASHDTTHTRTIDDAPGDGSVSVWASIPVLVIIGLLLGVLIVTAFVGGEPADNRPVIQTDAQLNAGDCFVLVGGVPRERSCATGTADGMVTQVGPEAGNCPQDTQPLKDPESDFFLCWARIIPGSANTVP